MLLEEIANENILYEAWKGIYAGKSDDVRERSKGIDEESLADFKRGEPENIRQISVSLLNGKYKLLPLKGFSEPKKSGNFRLISAPGVRDRIVHAAILSVIQKYFPEIRNGSSYCLPRTKKKSEKVNFLDAFRTLADNVRDGNTFVFESDIQSFFDNVVKRRLLNIVLSALPDTSIDQLIKKIIYFKVGNLDEFKQMSKKGRIKLPQSRRGLSQGSPLSPLFANIYLNEFDAAMIKQFHRRYIRYVDDFIVLCATAEETKYALDKAIKYLKTNGLTLPPLSEDSKSKTRIAVDLRRGGTFVFLGIKVSRTSLHPNFSDAESIKYIDRKCFATRAITMTLKTKKIPKSNAEKEKIVNLRVQSKFGVYGYFHTEELIEKLNKFIDIKSKQTKLKIRHIKSNRKGMPIIPYKDWQSLF